MPLVLQLLFVQCNRTVYVARFRMFTICNRNSFYSTVYYGFSNLKILSARCAVRLTVFGEKIKNVLRSVLLHRLYKFIYDVVVVESKSRWKDRVAGGRDVKRKTRPVDEQTESGPWESRQTPRPWRLLFGVCVTNTVNFTDRGNPRKNVYTAPESNNGAREIDK